VVVVRARSSGMHGHRQFGHGANRACNDTSHGRRPIRRPQIEPPLALSIHLRDSVLVAVPLSGSQVSAGTRPSRDEQTPSHVKAAGRGLYDQQGQALTQGLKGLRG
jgi:hypothetical protein